MTLSKKQQSIAWQQWLAELNPYCATTIHFLNATPPSQRSDAGRARQIDFIKAEIAEISLKLDRLYFNTPHVGSRVAKHDRFDAVCVIEKLGVHPHVHMAWIPGFGRRKQMHPVEAALRQCCLLDTFNRSTKELAIEDQALLDRLSDRRQSYAPTDVANWTAKGWSVFSRSICDDGWLDYVLKEMNFVPDFSDQVFFLSDRFSRLQRTKPTRYHSIDPHTGAHVLDLDAALVPKR